MSKNPTRENVKVVCRVRPENQKELAIGKSCIRQDNTKIEVFNEDGSHSFAFDRIFGPTSAQAEIFEYVAMPLINDVLSGYNATIFAYGQTSSGKTFTMEGANIRDPITKGIIPRSIEALFAGVSNADENIEFCFKVRDLLDHHRVKTNLLIREDKTNGIYIAGVTEEYATSEEELYGIMGAGALNRAVAATGMNEGSSRSHSVFLITVTQRDVSNSTSKSGKLYLVDLAGSETVKKTNSSGQQLEEAKTINKSLSALGQVIFALTDEKSTHVPYRDSKLTRILQDSLGGNAKTVLIIAASPSSYNAVETLSTLRFGTRAKSITNKVVLNATRSVEELEILLAKAEKAIDAQQSHIMGLVAQLQSYANSGIIPNESGARSESESLLIEKLKQQIMDLQSELDEERQESENKTMENQKLVALLVEKDAVLVEAGGIMQDCQQLYEHSKAKCEVLTREKSDLFVELQAFRSQADDDMAKVKFEMQELEVTVETLKAENAKLRNEIAEMSGDDMRQQERPPIDSTPAPKMARDRPTERPTESVSPTPTVGTTDDQSVRANKIRIDKISAKMARELDIGGRHESKAHHMNELHRLLESNNLTADSVCLWANSFADEMEDWFNMAEDKFLGFEKGGQELARRIKDLESHRIRLEKDLEYKAEKTFQQQLEMDIIRNEQNSSGASSTLQSHESHRMVSLQQRLEQLVAVHRQLLRKFASLELENGELRKKLVLRDERIKQLEANAKGLTTTLRQQAERHISELNDLRQDIEDLKQEQQNRSENKADNSAQVQHHTGPRVVRGGGTVPEAPRGLRGGGGKALSGNEADPAAASNKGSSGGILSRLLGSK